MTNVWFFIVPALVLAYIGTKIKKKDSQVFDDWTFPWGPATPCRFPGKIMFLIGTVCSTVGIYAAFKGPVRIGGLTLPQSPLIVNALNSATDKKANMKDKYSRKEKVKKVKVWASAKEYADTKVTISGKWTLVGKTKRVYKGTVFNNGDKKLRSVSFVLNGTTENKTLSVGNIDAFSKKAFSFSLGEHFWSIYKSGPYLQKAAF